tara:strand:+ start:22480 stop:22773 length:294 start_codon:yes stop_codon:yes gene_type:complete
MNSRAKAIFEEYCKSVQVHEHPTHTVEVVVSGKYFTELYSRVMECGYTCYSIITSSESDAHVAMFSISSMYDIGSLYDDIYDDDGEDESADWWKHTN